MSERSNLGAKLERLRVAALDECRRLAACGDRCIVCPELSQAGLQVDGQLERCLLLDEAVEEAAG